MFDTNVFPPQAPQQQQQASFPTFPDFSSFSQSTQLPLKPQVVHSNAPGGVQGVPSQPHQPVDNLFALFANDFSSNRGNECKTPNLNTLCYSQPGQQAQAPPARYGISGLGSNLTMPPTGVLGKHNTLEITSTTALNPKPQTGWGTSGMIPVSSSHGTNHNPHFQRPSVGPIAPARSSPNVAGATGNSGTVNTQSVNSGRRIMSSSPSVQHGQSASQQSGYANQQYSGGSSYRSYSGNNNGSRGSVGFSGRTVSRGGVRGGGHSTRGAIGGSYRSMTGGGNSRINHSRGNYGNRGGASSGDSISRRLPTENIQNDEDCETRTVNQSLVTSLSSASYSISTSSAATVSSPALTSTVCVTTTTNSVASVSVASSTCATASISTPVPVETRKDTITEFEGNLPVTTSVCGDTTVEPSNVGTGESTRNVEIDGPANAATSVSPSPDVSKGGQIENSSVLLVDGASDKLESVSLTSVIQNTESSSQMPLSVTTVKY